ncbi:SufE family protein [Aliikangiella sp. G2MR2-5]|uniref:SufE family protein n=1 Tax=Aliikangiella sp. G2MR2-5 TaxID=2788943 RepID=UPI00352C3315
MIMTTTEEIIDTLSFFDSWEDRYKYMIDLGKSLPAIDENLKTDERLVPGCQSQVWIEPHLSNGVFSFEVDSDAHIVRGLLAIVMAAYNNKTAEEILNFDIEDYFSKLDLVKHLSPTRGNGLKAMVEKIKSLAQASI